MHRNSQKRIYGDYVYFITCDVQDKIEFFKEEIFCDFWIEELKLAKEMKKFKLYAFCLNYDHFHLLIKPDKINYSQIMHFIKRHTSRNLNIILGYNKIDLGKMANSGEGDVGQRLLQNGNNTTIESDIGNFRQREFDKIIYQHRQKYIVKFGNDFHHPKFKWQKSFHDHIIRNVKDFNNHWNYTMYNYLKHNLPENWKYTGLNFMELIDEIE
ncbi:MAG: transposase [Candidatus Tenebribacter mawsonii]|nr:transposase [Candidatus Tenebribacter mawsonii]